MAPLLLAGFGIGFIALTVTHNGIDIVPDSIGWALFAFGMMRLAWRSPLFLAASVLAWVNTAVALLNFAPDVLPDAIADVVVFAYNVLECLTLVVGATAVAEAAKLTDRGTSRQFRMISLLFGATLIAFVTGWIIFASNADAGTTIIGGGSLAFLLTLIWLLVLLILRADRDYVDATQPVTQDPPRSRSGNPAKRATGQPRKSASGQ